MGYELRLFTAYARTKSEVFYAVRDGVEVANVKMTENNTISSLNVKEGSEVEIINELLVYATNKSK